MQIFNMNEMLSHLLASGYQHCSPFFRTTYPINRTDQLNIIQCFNQLRLLDYVQKAFNLHWYASIAHCLENIHFVQDLIVS